MAEPFSVALAREGMSARTDLLQSEFPGVEFVHVEPNGVLDNGIGIAVGDTKHELPAFWLRANSEEFVRDVLTAARGVCGVLL